MSTDNVTIFGQYWGIVKSNLELSEFGRLYIFFSHTIFSIFLKNFFLFQIMEILEIPETSYLNENDLYIVEFSRNSLLSNDIDNSEPSNDNIFKEIQDNENVINRNRGRSRGRNKSKGNRRRGHNHNVRRE